MSGLRIMATWISRGATEVCLIATKDAVSSVAGVLEPRMTQSVTELRPETRNSALTVHSSRKIRFELHRPLGWNLFWQARVGNLDARQL